MTRDMIHAIRALRWRNGSTRSSDTIVTKTAHWSLSWAVAFAWALAYGFAALGSGKPITLFVLVARGVRYAQAPLWGVIVRKKMTSRAKLRQVLLPEVRSGI